MCEYNRKMSIPVLLILVFLLMPEVSIHSGVPEPGITLYGEVRNLKNYLITSGEMEMTFTPTGGGDPVTVSSILKPIDVPGDTRYSYVLQIPVECKLTVAPHDAISPGCLERCSADQEYTRTATIDGVAATITNPAITLTPEEHRSSMFRLDLQVDIMLSANIIAEHLLGKIALTPAEQAAADKNSNGSVDIGDVIKLLIE